MEFPSKTPYAACDSAHRGRWAALTSDRFSTPGKTPSRASVDGTWVNEFQELAMPPNGVKKNSKRGHQYEHVKQSELDQGKSESTAEEIAGRTVNKEKARHGESKTASKTSTQDPKSSGQRGGERSGTNKPKGRTKDQLYAEAKKKNVEGRSSMTKSELEKAVN
jgi:hypothetical protein